MIKRPLLLAAVIYAAAMVIICSFFPKLIIPEIRFEEKEKINVSGKIYKFEEKTSQVYVYLNDVKAESAENEYSQYFKIAIITFDVSSYNDLDLKIGNRILSECIYKPLKEARNYGNYDERAYYHSLGIFLKVQETSTVITDESFSIPGQFLNDLRNRLVRNIYESVDDDETAGILAAICTGDRSGLTDDTRNIYRYSGIAHVLAISGLHISLIGMFVFRMLRKKLRFIYSFILSVLLMVCFLIMTGSSVSAVRATVMFIIQLISIGTGKNYDILSSLSLTALIMLACDPLLVTNPGFQLSYAAIASVGIIYKNLKRFFPDDIFKGRRFKGTGTKILSGMLLSISVYLGTLPVSASLYYEIPLYSVLVNIIVVPLMSAVLGAGLVSSILGIISLLLGRFFCGIGVYIVDFIKWSCLFVSKLPFSRIVTGCPDKMHIAIYYLVIIIWIKFIDIYSGNFEKAGRKPKVGNRIYAFLSFAAISICSLFIRLKTDILKIVFVDVGQGECILIESPSGNNYLIDAGSTSVKEVFKNRIEGALKYDGIRSVEYMIVTHPDSDHINGLTELLKNNDNAVDGFNISVNNIMIPDFEGNDEYEELIYLAKENNINIMNIHADMSVNDGSLIMTCLSPDIDQYTDNLNNRSAVIDLAFHDFHALFTGDLEAEGENILLKNNRLEKEGYELLKVGHHGSSTSSSEGFIAAVMPGAAVISAGVNNIYGHPHRETLNTLTKAGADIFVTAQMGEIFAEISASGKWNLRYKISQNTV